MQQCLNLIYRIELDIQHKIGETTEHIVRFSRTTLHLAYVDLKWEREREREREEWANLYGGVVEGLLEQRRYIPC